jgi:hypothetical protein
MVADVVRGHAVDGSLHLLTVRVVKEAGGRGAGLCGDAVFGAAPLKSSF